MRLPIPLQPLPRDPLVSIFITNYNYARFVSQAIQSVLDQTYPHWELIVVDDGSTDDSLAVISQYQDPRIQLLAKPNGGMASSWNAAYQRCRGELLLPLDADDFFYPRKIESILSAFAQDPQAALAVHAMTVRGADGRDVQNIPFLSRFEQGWLAERVVRRGGRWRYMPTSALCFRRELAEFLFPIPEQTFFIHADALAVTLGPLLTRVVALPEPLSYYRVHGANSLGGDVKDAPSARKVINFTLSTIRGVNARLAELGLSLQLDESRNLEFLQAVFVQCLFDGTPRPLLRQRRRSLLAALRADDLYSPAQKFLGTFVYGLAPLLPSWLRAIWIGNALGYSRTKHAVQEALRLLRRRPVHPAATA